MKFSGFEQADFDLFLIEGLESRMEALINQLRPKFYALGEDLKVELSEIVGYELYPHVAKHARRKTNPPNDSWLAFGGPRGYKMVPHFQITVWHTHVLVQWGIIYEAPNKTLFADNLLKHREQIKNIIPADFQWSKDHMKPEGVRMSAMTDVDFEDFAHRLAHNKNGEIMIGQVISREDAIKLSPQQFYTIVTNAWSSLARLHHMAR
jgi:uncharacterized protein YktB (UPF0637 family)